MKNSFFIQREMYLNKQVQELQRLSDTPWWCRATSCENALQRLECILRLLKETSPDDTGARAVSARGLLAQIDAEVVHLLQFFSDILGKVKKVSQQLQDQQADLGEACTLISSLCEDLLDIRNSNLIERYSDNVTQLCKKCSISPTTTRSRKRNRQPSRRIDEFIVLESCTYQHLLSSPRLFC